MKWVWWDFPWERPLPCCRRRKSRGLERWYSFPPPKPGDRAARAVHFLSVLYTLRGRVRTAGAGDGPEHTVPGVADAGFHTGGVPAGGLAARN